MNSPRGSRMVRNAARFIGLVAIACAIGCDSGGSGTIVTGPLATVSVFPPNDVVPQSTSADFDATVTTDVIGVKDSVHWRVEGTGCTGNACGTITSIGPQTGRFVAPRVAPIPSTVAVNLSKAPFTLETIMWRTWKPTVEWAASRG